MKRFLSGIIKVLKYLLIFLFSVFVVAIVLFRFVESEFNEFKNTTILEHRKHLSTDGPFILHSDDSVRLISVERQGNKFDVKDKTYGRERLQQTFLVESYAYDNPQGTCFEVKLQDQLSVAKSTYPKAEKLFVVSDIEGNFYAFHKLLKANNVIDEQCNWNFGDGHLVLVGDFMDRGLNVTQCLWLVYKLENQAQQCGGCVHFILGNRDLLDLKGSVTQVRSKYKRLANKLNLDYSNDLYGTNSELGKWLRTKNAIEKIGNFLFVHAGITQKLIDLNLSIKEMNRIVRNDIGMVDYSDSVSATVHEGTLTNRVFGHDQNENTATVINNTKEYFGVETIIIGHSTCPDIYQQYDGALINVDVHFPNRDSDEFRGKALLIEKDVRYKVDDLGNKTRI